MREATRACRSWTLAQHEHPDQCGFCQLAYSDEIQQLVVSLLLILVTISLVLNRFLAT